MFENCKLFSNKEPIEWWMNNTKAEGFCIDTINDDKEFIKKLNGADINDFSVKIENQGSEEKYNSLKEFLFERFLNDYNKMNDFELLMHKRATIHINELFDKYVDENTLVITSSFQHISAERAIDKCKNVFKFDDLDENSNIIYRIKESIIMAKQYEKVFVYLIGTEFGTGRRHSNEIYKQLHDELVKLGKPFIMVMDAAQEMFLFPRDYSFYHYVIDTVHSLYTPLDVGLLFINKNFVSEEDIKSFTGYKRCDVLERIFRGLEIALNRRKYILMYHDIINDSIDHTLFEGYKLHSSQSNFYSMYNTGLFLYDKECVDLVTDKFINHALLKDPGVDVQIDYHKKIKELYIRMRAQTLMFDVEDAIQKYNYFYNNYRELQKLILKQSMK